MQIMSPRIFLFSQPNCLACEIVKMFLEARELPFEERDFADLQVRAEWADRYRVTSTPTVVILTAAGPELIEGFNPDRIDQCLTAAG
jgi:thioredoxin-related protein